MMREIAVNDGTSGSGSSAASEASPLKPLSVRKPKKHRVAIFIDGSNLYFKLRTLIPVKMDFIGYRYRDLALSLLAENERLAYIGYYVGAVRDTKRTVNHLKTLELLKNQQKLFEQLRHQQIEIVKGYLLERDGTYFEKGVDVRLALDIVTMAQARSYDVAVVISSDTDVILAISAARRLKRQVMYVGFEHQPSLALIRYADRSRLIGRTEAERYTHLNIAVKRFDDTDDV